MSFPMVLPSQAELIREAKNRIGIDPFLRDLRRGGIYEPLFVHIRETQLRVEKTIWMNAWLITPEHKARLEAQEGLFNVDPYIQQGFHPGFWVSGGEEESFGYETIYGREAEPLVLGWSADGKSIDATLSQEFERFYRLTSSSDSCTTRWDSWQESFKDVVVREVRDSLCSVIVHRDFLADFQDVRHRWFMLAYYGEWRRGFVNPTYANTQRTEPSTADTNREHFIGIVNQSSNDFDHLEIKGYLLLPPPTQPQFSRKFGAVPVSVQTRVEKIELDTSHGKVKPWEVREKRHQSRGFLATAVFDQEVLRRYQDEPGAEINVHQFGELWMSARHLHVTGGLFLLGTEYVSAVLGYFIEGVPPSEWVHWQSFNIPFIGSSRHQQLFYEPSLFALTTRLQRLPQSVNDAIQNVLGLPGASPFGSMHGTDKDFKELVRALPRTVSAPELVRRAQALHGFVLAGLSEHEIRRPLAEMGYPQSQLEELHSLKLFTSLVAICALTQRAIGWCQDQVQARAFGLRQFLDWRARTSDPRGEDSRIVEDCLTRLDAIFGVQKLRLLSAHPIATDMERSAKDILLEMHISPSDANYREATLGLYRLLISCLEFVRDLGDLG